MLSLKQIQEAFTEHVMARNDVITGYVAGTNNVPSEKRLDIYRNAYRERLIETLANDYEILTKLLGEETFRRLCIAYIDKNPSSHYSLRWFGYGLPSFLDYSPDKGSHDWEAEMAQLEWLFIDAFDSANTSTVSEQDAAAIPPDQWPTLSVTFHPSVRVVRLWWNTLDLWQAAKNDEQPPAPVRLAQYSHCLLWRNNLITQFRSLDNFEAVALSAAADGATFSEICGALAEELHDPEQVPIKAASYLKGWLASGMLTKFYT